MSEQHAFVPSPTGPGCGKMVFVLRQALPCGQHRHDAIHCPELCEACLVVEWIREHLNRLLCPWQIRLLHDVTKHTCDHPGRA